MPLIHKNINVVDDRNLCTECGTCWGVCPKSNIIISNLKNGRLRFRVSEPSLCGRCKLCLQVCPGMNVDFTKLNNDVFKTHSKIENAIEDIGHYQNLYLGYALDEKVRFGGASGGITTALLAAAINTYHLDGVFVTKMNEKSHGSPLAANIYLAKNDKDLLAGQQSKYTTVPMGKCLRDIIYDGKGKRFAFVGLGCHMQALRKAEELIPVLKRRIIIRMGLVCGHCMDWRGTRHLFSLLKVKEKSVNRVEFRSDRWPGNFKVTLQNGNTRTIGQIDWTSYVMTLYEKHRCHFCTDPLNQLSDISTGDPWLNELAHEPGLNLVISRSKIGEELISKAVSGEKIVINSTNKEKIVRSQRRSLYRKKFMIRAYMHIAKLAGNSIPQYTGQFDSIPLTWREYREAIVLSFFRFLSDRPIFNRIITISGRTFMAYMRKRRKTAGRMVLK